MGLLHSWVYIFFYRTGWTCMCMEPPWSTICTTLCWSEVQILWWFHYGLSDISHDARTDLHFFDFGSMNALMCTKDVFLNYVMLYMPFVDANSLFTKCMSAHGTIDTHILGKSWNCTIWVANWQPRLEPNWTHPRQARQTHSSLYSPGKFPQGVENCLARRIGRDTARRDPCVTYW